jgi:DNA-binding MarR family transcriptional regulator
MSVSAARISSRTICRSLPSGAVAEKLVTRVRDVPRLVDRLVDGGLLERVRHLLLSAM